MDSIRRADALSQLVGFLGQFGERPTRLLSRDYLSSPLQRNEGFEQILGSNSLCVSNPLQRWEVSEW